jgi:hypothetical protein
MSPKGTVVKVSTATSVYCLLSFMGRLLPCFQSGSSLPSQIRWWINTWVYQILIGVMGVEQTRVFDDVLGAHV